MQTIKIIIALALSLLVSVNVSANTSLEKPISVVLSDIEAAESESLLRKGAFDTKDFDGVLVFEGVLVAARSHGHSEMIYRFKVSRNLKSVMRKSGLVGKQFEVVAPAETKNGGIDLKIGKRYRVGSPELPDGRYGIWRGIVIEI